jgi:NAD(P)-dependent dehydrogenase (short-subunit alcohol dehydrogenase family)
MSTDDQTRRDGASVGARHLLLVGAGPGLGAAIARRFARDGYRVTLVTRSPATTAPFAARATVSPGKLTLRGAATMLARQAAQRRDPRRQRHDPRPDRAWDAVRSGRDRRGLLGDQRRGARCLAR